MMLTTRGLSSRALDQEEKNMLGIIRQKVGDAGPLRDMRPNESLKQYIKSFLIYAGDFSDGGSFIPAAEFLLEKILTPERVLNELKNSGLRMSVAALGIYRDMICGLGLHENSNQRYRIVFSMLVWIEKVKEIDRFLSPGAGISDSDLPLTLCYTAPRTFEMYRRNGDGQAIQVFRDFSEDVLRDFNSHQWYFVAAYFTRIANEDQLQVFAEMKSTIFPWSYVGNTVTMHLQIEGIVPGTFYVGPCSMSLVRIHGFNHVFDHLLPTVFGSTLTVCNFAVMRFDPDNEGAGFMPKEGALKNCIERFLRQGLRVDYGLLRMLESWKGRGCYHVLIGYSDK